MKEDLVDAEGAGGLDDYFKQTKRRKEEKKQALKQAEMDATNQSIIVSVATNMMNQSQVTMRNMNATK